MSRKFATVAVLAITALAVAVFELPGASRAGAYISHEMNSQAGTNLRAHFGATYGRLPMGFEPNLGRASAEARYIARGHGYSLALAPTEAVLSLNNTEARDRGQAVGVGTSPRVRPASSTTLRMQLLGANPQPAISGLDPLSGKVNYFTGNDPLKWHTKVPTYRRVKYSSVYPAIDLLYYGAGGELEYDFVLASGADPSAIALHFEGASEVEIDDTGDLLLHTRGGVLRQSKPYTYQEIGGARQEVPSRYILSGDRVSFQLGHYDVSRPLVIDPRLDYSTFLGGEGGYYTFEQGSDIAVDGYGNAYIVGTADPLDFPITPGAYGSSPHADADTDTAFIVKLNAKGDRLLYSAYLDGAAGRLSIVVDRSGNAYITGTTYSNKLPTTPKAYDRRLGGNADAFVTKLDADGSRLLYSTLLGGSKGDPPTYKTVAEAATDLAIDNLGSAYVTGITPSHDFPTTAGAFDRSYNGGETDTFVVKLDGLGSRLLFSTYLGGHRKDGRVVGEHGRGTSIAVDSHGHAYVTGYTISSSFPTTSRALDRLLDSSACRYGYGTCYESFVTKLQADGSGLVYSTFLGGAGLEVGTGIAVDADGNAFVTGYTTSRDFPTTPGAYARRYKDWHHPGGEDLHDIYVTKLRPDGSRPIYSTYLGGYSYDQSYAIVVDASGAAYITGTTGSDDYPTTADALDRSAEGYPDILVTKLNSTGSRLVYSTVMGNLQPAAGNGIAISFPADGTNPDAARCIYVTGIAQEEPDEGAHRPMAPSDFPTSPEAYDRTFNGGLSDAFVVAIDLGDTGACSRVPDLPDTGAGGMSGGSVPVEQIAGALGILVGRHVFILR